MTKRLFFILLVILCQSIKAQSTNGYQPTYHLPGTGNRVADKNFYVLVAIQPMPAVQQALEQDDALDTQMNGGLLSK